MADNLADNYSIKEYILYKLDRSLAVVGLVILGGFSPYRNTPESVQIVMAVVGGLVGYIGGRSGDRKNVA